MKSKSLILMFVSLGFGLIAAIGISQVMGRSGGGGSSMRMAPVVVATDFIDINTVLTEEIVKVEEWPINIIPEKAAQSLEQLQNMSAARAIQKGAPLFLTDLVNKDSAADLAIKPGQRLISLKVGPEQISNGLMKPGDRVDIIGTFTMGSGQNQTTFATTFLKNIQVYSVNDSFQRQTGPREAGDAKQNSIVGLVVSEKQAEKLAIVQRVGTLSFVMRGKSSVNDSDDTEDGEPLPSWLVGNGGAPVAKPETKTGSDSGIADSLRKLTQRTERPKLEEMVLWHAGERTVVRFNADGTLVPAEPAKPSNPYPALNKTGAGNGDQDSSALNADPALEADSYLDQK